MAEIKVDLIDSQEDGNQKFANLLDVRLFAAFEKAVKDTSEKRSLQELFDAWLDGEL